MIKARALLPERSVQVPPSTSVLRRRCAYGEASGPIDECGACRRGTTLQRAFGRQAEPTTIPSIVREVLHSPGQPLDAATHAFMGSRLGHDFSHVRIHTDTRAAESVRAVNARAFTVGNDIVFSSGRYAPTTGPGMRLLAHELAHVVEQGGNTADRPAEGARRIGKADDPSEREARHVAERVGSGQPTLRGPSALEPRHLHAQPTSLQRAVDYDECTLAQERIVLDSHRRAIEMVDTAITKLGSYSGTTPADVRAALDRHFHSSGTGLAAWILFNLSWLKSESGSPTYECETPQVGNRLGWSMWCVPFTDIELYPLWFAEADIDKRGCTMIHEWVHRYGCNFDLGYEWEQGYSGHGTLRALLNADPWAHFVYDVR